jgi:hypothetical protein
MAEKPAAPAAVAAAQPAPVTTPDVQKVRPEAPQPTVSAEAADSLARVEDIPQDPARPFTSGAKPARNMSSPGKFVTTEPGGWPPVVGVPVPRAGGVGVSPVPRWGAMPDGRFQ